MKGEHLSRDEMLSYTNGLLDQKQTDEVSAHLMKCAACHEQQSQMAMTAIFAKMQAISKENEQWTCSDPFWGLPYPNAAVTPPRSEAQIQKWESTHKLRLPVTLARALGTQNGGCVRGTELIICPLAEFALLSEPKWDSVFRFGQIASDRDELLYIGFEDQIPASIILNYASGDQPTVLYLWHDLGDELREVADSFDALLASRRDGSDQDSEAERE